MERRFGPYLLGEPLTATPFGELVSATHTARSQPLALLLLAPALSADHRFRGLVRLEMARFGGMRMDGLARTVEIAEQAGALAVVYERPADSASLPTGDGARGSVAVHTAVSLIEQLAAVLDAAHARRIVHGVLGPTVVLLGPDGSTGLIGLGLLNAIEEAGLGPAVLAQSDQTEALGLAPEQHGGPLAVATADGYALGALAARLLPTPRAGAAAVLARQQANAPAQRFPSCSAFATALIEAFNPATSAELRGPGTQSAAASPSAQPAPVSIVSPPAARQPQPPTRPAPHPSDAPPWTPPQSSVSQPATAPAVPLPTSASEPAESKVSVTHHRPTPAMLASRKAHQRIDQISGLVMTAVQWTPPLDQIVEQYAPNGRLGPVPLGLAVLGALSVVLLLVGLPVLMGMLVAVILGAYGLPPLIAKLTAGEQPPLEAVRVRGGLRASPETAGMGGNAFRLDGPDGRLAPLPAAVFRYAASVGQPITDERWSSRGTEFINAGYLLPDHAATVLLPDRILLDLRDASDTVIYRHASYAGEPRDRAAPALLSDAVTPAGQRAAPYGAPTTPPTWSPTATGRLLVQAPSPALIEELGAAFTRTAWIAAFLTVLPIALLVIAIGVGQYQFLLFAITIFLVGFIGLPIVQRVWQLNIARRAPAIVRADGDTHVRAYNPPGQIKGQQTRRYGLRLDDGNEVRVPKELFDRLSREGQFVSPESAPDLWASRKGEGDTLTVHSAPGLSLVFEPVAGLLLELRDASGQLVYRDPATSEYALRPRPETGSR